MKCKCVFSNFLLSYQLKPFCTHLQKKVVSGIIPCCNQKLNTLNTSRRPFLTGYQEATKHLLQPLIRIGNFKQRNVKLLLKNINSSFISIDVEYDTLIPIATGDTIQCHLQGWEGQICSQTHKSSCTILVPLFRSIK